MKLLSSFSAALFATALLCMPVAAGTTVIDFGAAQDNCCGDIAHVPFTTPIEAGDPAAITHIIPNAGTPAGDYGPISLSDGATISWTQVSAWNNGDGSADTHQTFFLNRAGDPNDTLFTVATANPLDLVTIDFLGGPDRESLITIGGTGTVIPNGGGAMPVTPAWTNVVTGAVGSVTGELTENVGFDEGNISAARITITPATVPEPGSIALLGLGACTAVLRRRRS